ncbi:MAG: LacI family DNA-binding transcriptional regulator [Motilibacteraceae bacterium]
MGRTAVTVRDVARHANVSSGTVSRVLNQHHNVAGELRERVLRSAAELGYLPRQVRAGVPTIATTPARSIGYLLTLPHLPTTSDLMAPFWAGVLHGVETEAGRRGASVTYRSLPGAGVSPAEVVERIGELGIDATLLVGVPSPEVVEAVEHLGIPVVVVDSQLEGAGHDAVLPDYAEGARQVVDEMLRAGHQDIAFIGGPLLPGSAVRNAVPAIEQRARGLRDALAHAGVPFRPELVESCDLTQQGAYAATRRLLAGDAPFTGLFCANDVTASGALLALREHGCIVPDDVSVVGAGDELGAHTFPPLTTFRLDLPVLGAVAVHRLLARADDPQTPAVTTLVPVDLVRRSSVAPPRR